MTTLDTSAPLVSPDDPPRSALGERTSGRGIASAAAGFGVVLIAIALAMVLRFVMDPLLGNTEPFPTLYGAVALAAWYGGYKLGLLATVLGYLAANFLIIEPRWAFGLPRPADLLALPLYLVSCCIITGFASAMRTARNRYKAAAHDAFRRQEELEHEIAERTQSEERLRLALDAGRMVTWEWDIRTDEITQSADSATLRSSSTGDRDGTASQFIHPDDLKAVLKTAAQTGSGRTEYESEFRQSRPDGRIHWMLQKGKIVSDDHGQPVRMIGVSIDITERKQAEEAIKDADRRKEEFLAILSHELRSPLNVVLLWVRLLRSGVVDAAMTRRALEIIEENARLQNRLNADLLDVSRIISGKLTLDMRTVDLARLTVIAVDSQRPLAAAKRISIDVRVADDVGLIVGDPARLEQVIGNLLSNALKYTPENGRIDVALLRTKHAAQLVVSDSGKGIRPEFLPFVFERFQQDEGERGHGGLGLGLYMVRRLVELHGGRVSARSEGEGRGATFTIELPVSEASGGPAPTTPVAAPRPLPSESVNLSGVHVLVIDDDARTGEVLTAVLRQHGADAIDATSARGARDVLKTLTPDVLLCDLAMPDEDGFTFIAELRARGDAPQRGIPAIALTASASREDRARAFSAGFDRYLLKPVEASELCLAIAEVCRGRLDRAATPGPGGAP